MIGSGGPINRMGMSLQQLAQGPLQIAPTATLLAPECLLV